MPACDRRREAERCEVDEASPVRRLQRVVVAFQLRRVRKPLRKVPLHACAGALRCAGTVRGLGGSHVRDDVELGFPLAVWFDADPERQSTAVNLRRGRRRDLRRPAERSAVVAETKPAVSTRVEYFPFFASASLTSNRSAKSQPASTRTVRFAALSAWFRIVSSSWKPSRDRALPDDRQLRVDVDSTRPGHEEEAGFEVLEVVYGERVETLAVHREDPSREEAGIEGEEAGRVGQRRLDVPALVAHDERVAVEDLDEVVAHELLFA